MSSDWSGGGVATPVEQVPPRIRQAAAADRIVKIAEERYRFGRTPKGDLFAVELGGSIAKMLRGGNTSVRAELAHLHYKEHGSVASASAVADAMQVLEGKAQERPPELVFLRVARCGEAILVDLGDNSGHCVEVTPQGWRVLPTAPVLFRRTELTGAMPAPQRGGSLELLRELLNCTDTSWPLIVGWMVAAFFEEIAHPILLLLGEQGTGKSTAARIITGIVDPSPAPLRAPPRDEDRWQICAAGSWVVAVDNISSIPEWFSDVMCRAVTGDARITRRLYSDDGLAVLEYRRVMLLNGIDVQALRGDLGSRLMLVELERIESKRRENETDLLRRYEAARPLFLGALFDVLATVLLNLPEVRLVELPRMADFARILAAIDDADIFPDRRVLDGYLSQEGQIARDVIDANPIATLLMGLVGEYRVWSASSATVLQHLNQHGAKPPPKDWPRNPKHMSVILRRLAPSLRQMGCEVEEPTESNRVPGTGERLWRFVAPPADAATPSDVSVATPPLIADDEELPT